MSTEMLTEVTPAPLSEEQFAALVETLASAPDGRGELTALLREDHPLYDQRGTATIVRMRGWILLALARAGVSDRELLFVLEELDTGADAYLVAAAARALRAYPRPSAAFAPYVVRAIANIRYRDDPVSFDSYGEYGSSSASTSPVRELLATLAWLGPHARGLRTEIEELRSQRGLSRKLLTDLDRALEAIGGSDSEAAPDGDVCCTLPAALTRSSWWPLRSRRGGQPVQAIAFEDHSGTRITFGEAFHERPTIVAFFYTRCDNPLKCSLTITKLARVQALLDARGLADSIQTAGITYDPGFDLPDRLRVYGESRGVRLDARHRLLRTVEGFDALRRHFELGVSFIESLVNRHRIEVYVVDGEGRVAASFERLHWDEREVVDRAVAVLEEARVARPSGAAPESEPGPAAASRESMATGAEAEQESEAKPQAVFEPRRSIAAGAPTVRHRLSSSPLVGTLASLGIALFPKCPVCWAAYLSVFGVAGLERIPYAPWLEPLLAALMLINVASVWVRGRATGRVLGAWLVSAGALAIVLSRMAPAVESAAAWGVALTLAGSLLATPGPRRRASDSLPRPVTELSRSRVGAS